MADASDRVARQQIADRAELVAVTRAKEELERMLHAQKLRAQVERETREDMHAKTIKVSTILGCH